jgi:hypothetical protein
MPAISPTSPTLVLNDALKRVRTANLPTSNCNERSQASHRAFCSDVSSKQQSGKKWASDTFGGFSGSDVR